MRVLDARFWGSDPHPSCGPASPRGRGGTSALPSGETSYSLSLWERARVRVVPRSPDTRHLAPDTQLLRAELHFIEAVLPRELLERIWLEALNPRLDHVVG